MRADRLVATLLLLQRRESVTAAEVAEELEISERTARRDLEALGTAGLPVYSQQGRNGGWRLAGGGRTDLSGLSASEVRALFLVAGPSTASPDVKSALRKLVRALPDSFRADAEAASEAIIVDRSAWDDNRSEAPTPTFLDDVQRAVVQGFQAEMAYIDRTGASSTRTVHPLGLAAKGLVWYLIANTDKGLRTFRVDRMRAFDVTDQRVTRPKGFVLADAWALVTSTVNERRMPLVAVAHCTPDVVGLLRYVFAARLTIGPPAKDGVIPIEIRGPSVEQLAAQVAGFGGRIVVEGPTEVRERIQAIGEELVAAYTTPKPTTRRRNDR